MGTSQNTNHGKITSLASPSLFPLSGGSSVVVCAPTGSGKTAIAEAATVAALARGQRVIYTTPLKALSNQKLGEMRELFGKDLVGLQTGDASLNHGTYFYLIYCIVQTREAVA